MSTEEAIIAAVREALLRAESNIELHIEREVYESSPARAIIQEYREQFAVILGSETGATTPAEGFAGEGVA